MRNLAELDQSVNAKIIEVCWKVSIAGSAIALLIFLSPFTKGHLSQLFWMCFYLITGFGTLTYFYKFAPTKHLKYYFNVIMVPMIVAIAIVLRNPEVFNLFYFLMAINLSYRDRILHFTSSAAQLILYIVAGLYYPILLPAPTIEDSTFSLLVTRATLFSVVVVLVDVLNHYSAELTERLSRQEVEITTAALTDSVSALVEALEAKDCYTNGHSQRVSRYALIIASHLLVSDLKEEYFHTAGLLHDIGKIGMPDSVLSKTGPLSNEEFALIKDHPIIGAKILENAKSLAPIIPMVLHHHERFDGGGYPYGLKGEAIPLEARILAVADSFDAMTSDRPYRQALSPTDAYEEILRQKEKQFCPKVVEAFLNGYGEIVTEFIRTH